jgi:predicted PurR-regulated permease PerM
MLVQVKALFISLFFFLKAILLPFLIAMMIAYLLHPVVNLLCRRKMPRTIAVVLIYVIFIISGAVIVMNLTPILMKQLNELNEHLPQFTMRAQNFIANMNDNDLLPQSIRMGINAAIMQAEEQIAQAITKFINRLDSTINALFIALVIPFLAFYILKDFHLIERSALAFVPPQYKQRTINMVTEIDQALGSYIRGQLLVSLIIGTCAYIGYWLIDLPYPLLLAMIVSLFNIVPYIGPFFGALPALLVASTVSLKMVLFVILVNFICQFLEGNLISPQIVGRTLHMHPLVIILVLLIGGEIGGILGLILAVPLYAVAKVIAHHAWLFYKQRNSIV